MDEFFMAIGATAFVVILIIGGVVGICAIFADTDVRIFNEAHSTHYTTWEWLCSSETIKDYMDLGKKNRLELSGSLK
jgi:hypothetical protein